MDKANNIRILVVDDEEDLCEILRFNLETEGYCVDTAPSGEEALAKSPSGYSLVLLDVMMDGMNGFEVARRIREDEQSRRVPIIFLTAKGGEDDKVRGFNLGADDYIPKPFSVRELLLRVRAVLRRTQASGGGGGANRVLRYRGLAVDTTRKAATVDGREVSLTRTELGLLSELLENRGRVLSRSDLLKRVWPQGVIVTDRTVDVNITRLRKKLGPYAGRIITRLGFGYYFDA